MSGVQAASDDVEEDSVGAESGAPSSSRTAEVTAQHATVHVHPHQNNQESSPNNEVSPEVQYFQKSDALKQKIFKDLDMELDMTLKELSKRKPPVAPRKPYREPSPNSMSDSDQDTLKTSSIMAKVSKFEYYAKQQKIGRSQFYTNENVDYSPKVFSSNSLTVNTPAKDVLGSKNTPAIYKNSDRKMVSLNENNSIDAKSCSYANVMIKNKISKIDDMVRNFDDIGVNLKKVNNIENERLLQEHLNNREGQMKQALYNKQINFKESNESKVEGKFSRIRIDQNYQIIEKPYSPPEDPTYGRIERKSDIKFNKPSPSFDRNPHISSPVFNVSSHMERKDLVEHIRLQAYRDRIEEQKQREAENARLEEILNICAEYEKQGSTGTPSTPTEKRSQNKIITNGSLPRSLINNPNFVQTSDGYFKFDTSQTRAHSKSHPPQRNLSQYDNLDFPTSPALSPHTPCVTTRKPSSYENVGRLDEIGIPVNNDISSPVMIRKFQEALSPKSSPYENVFYGKLPFKPQSPNTSSPRTRIKTTFAHKNVSPPQYFVFPTPPPIEDDSKKIQDGFSDAALVNNDSKSNQVIQTNEKSSKFIDLHVSATEKRAVTSSNANILNNHLNVFGIEKQLSLDEEIPMIDDETANHLESRSSQIMSRDISPEKAASCDNSNTSVNSSHLIHDNLNTSSDSHANFIKNGNAKVALCTHEYDNLNTNSQDFTSKVDNSNANDHYKVNCENPSRIADSSHIINRKFDDVKKELKADIPELEQFERDLADNKRDQIIRRLANDVRYISERPDSEVSTCDEMSDLKIRYDEVRDTRRKLLSEIHELKAKMSEIRIQEDDILRELEMEKALIKGEYDSEIAILNIEQKNKKILQDKARRAEEEIQAAKTLQEVRQRELKARVDVATVHVERLEESFSSDNATSEELQNARDILENETKLYEDLEFQHLETESEMLAYREDLQNQIMILTKKIDSQKTRILTLKAEANNNLTSALDETRVLQSKYKKLLSKVEELTNCVQKYEKELKDIGTKINADRPQSPLSIYSETIQDKDHSFSSDSEEINFDTHRKLLNDKFNCIDQMSQSMIVDLGEKRQINDLIDSVTMANISEFHCATKANPEESKDLKEKKGFWERNFDSLSRLKKKKSQKSDIMSQSLNENMFFNNENIESDYGEVVKFGSMKKKKKPNGSSTPVKNSAKVPTFSALAKIIKKDSFKKSESKDKKGIRFTPDIEEILNESGIETENERSSYADSLEGTIEDLPDKTSSSHQNASTTVKAKSEHESDKKDSGIDQSEFDRNVLRKSLGDDPCMFKLTDKVPSQDDIDRISKVRMNSPLVSNQVDKNSLGRKTLDSLMEIERNRLTLLEEQGCQVIEHEREKISQLKRRVQNETKQRWEKERDAKSRSRELEKDNIAVVVDKRNDGCDRLTSDNHEGGHSREHSFEFDAVSSTTYADESSGVASSSVEELQSRSTSDVRRRDGARPLSDTSDVSNDNARSSFRVAPYWARSDLQRPLTRYLPIDRDDLDLRHHIESAGHHVALCPHVHIDRTACRGYLHKLGAKFHAWSKRWFVFDRDSKTFIYYSDKSERKPRGGAYFQVIEEVYLDHGNQSRSPSPQTTFVVKTRQRRYYLMAASGEAARIWIDVVFSGAQGYLEYLQ